MSDEGFAALPSTSDGLNKLNWVMNGICRTAAGITDPLLYVIYHNFLSQLLRIRITVNWITVTRNTISVSVLIESIL